MDAERNPAVAAATASAITGAHQHGQVHAGASGADLSDDLLSAIDQATGDGPVTEPVLAPAPSTADRPGAGAVPEVRQATGHR
ncbi:hypothetical protein C3492_05870 [Streptomyces sp. Ru62]|uniref:hypothetical protein n=1 Tax=Streptomyces sp. Ru62 TaxID=2080745 RepID=UPI000CDD5C9B|nr:hypothetical protein [Streptomyces sp. Ru62]POX64553.1 hypothetical protein C3492_05870 [Streptomyces sp. Ru62]